MGLLGFWVWVVACVRRSAMLAPCISSGWRVGSTSSVPFRRRPRRALRRQSQRCTWPGSGSSVPSNCTNYREKQNGVGGYTGIFLGTESHWVVFPGAMLWIVVVIALFTFVPSLLALRSHDLTQQVHYLLRCASSLMPSLALKTKSLAKNWFKKSWAFYVTVAEKFNLPQRANGPGIKLISCLGNVPLA